MDQERDSYISAKANEIVISISRYLVSMLASFRERAT